VRAEDEKSWEGEDLVLINGCEKRDLGVFGGYRSRFCCLLAF